MMMATVKLPTYDYQSAWSTYLHQFKVAALANGWSNKKSSFIIPLCGDARNVSQSASSDKQAEYRIPRTHISQ